MIAFLVTAIFTLSGAGIFLGLTFINNRSKLVNTTLTLILTLIFVFDLALIIKVISGF